MTRPGPPLRLMAVRWMAWATVTRVGRDVINVAGRLILARLLWPEAFGLFTLAWAITFGVKLGFQLQLEASIVQRRDLDRDLLSTAHWSLVGLSGAAALLVAGLAQPLGDLVAHPATIPLLRLLSLYVVIDGFGAIPRAWLSRNMAFRPLAWVGLWSEGVGTGIAVGAALLGAGAVALVIHAIVTSLTEVILLWMAVPWRPGRHWRTRELTELCRFGGPLVGRRGIEYLVSQGDRFVIGYLFGAGALGLYAVAVRLVKGVVEHINAIFDRVAFPAFTHTRDDPGRTRTGFLDALRVQAVVVFPLSIGLGLLARELVPVVLGRQWTGAGPLMVIVAGRAALASLGVIPRAALLAAGRQWLLLALSVGSAAAFAAGWGIGIPWGLTGVVSGGAVAAAFIGLLTVWLAKGDVGVTMTACLRALLPACFATGLMTAGIQVTRLLVADSGSLSGPVRLAVLVAAGGLCYAVPLLPWIHRERRRFRTIPQTRPS